MTIKRGTIDIAVKDIRDAIAKYGLAAGPKIVRDTIYPEVPRATWQKWLRKARATANMQAAAVIRDAVEVMPADVLPATPSPAIIARSPVAQKANLDFMGRLERLYTDGEMLREHSVITGPDGAEKIKIATMFANSIRIRSDLLERAIQAYQALYDWQQMKGFYDVIVQEIGKLDPETSARIMERLDELNRDKGFNANSLI